MAKKTIKKQNDSAESGKTRFQQVKDILTTANNKSTADYQGLNDPKTGKFWWDLPIEEFVKVEIAGVRMIAPEGNVVIINGEDVVISVPEVADYNFCAPGNSASSSGGSCCGSMSKPIKTSPGRGAASGLIIALKGQPPFNAPIGHFPKFMWGGNSVSDLDIQFISDWIDDGCPDTPVVVPKTNNMLDQLKVGKERHFVSQSTSNSIQTDRNGYKQRKDVDHLNDEELCKWRYVHNEMIQLNDYKMDKRNWIYWGRLHGDECQHGWEQFLLWHRMFLYEFEQRCQDILPDVTIPYWNWPSSRYLKGSLKNPKNVKLPKSIKKQMPLNMTSGVVPKPYQCFLNDKGAKVVGDIVRSNKVKELSGYYFDCGTEFFWALETLIGSSISIAQKEAVRKVLIEINPLWYPFRFPALFYDENGKPQGESGMQGTFHHHFPEQQDVDAILNIERWIDFAGGGNPQYHNNAYGALDMNPHNTVHIWVGGFNPHNPSSKVAPIEGAPTESDDYPYLGNWFAREASMGDMLNNLTACYDPVFWPHHSMVDWIFHRWQEKHPGQGPATPDAPLSGLSYDASAAASIYDLGYEYVKSSYNFESNKSLGYSKFSTAEANISGDVMGNHNKVELRMHNIIQPNQSYGVRVFINQPDANKNTPIRDNDCYAGYMAFFGHGDCIGGPGHCDPPSGQRRAYDRRPAHHNTPRNIRMDVTECVKKLKSKGHKDMQVSLVVVSPDSSKTPDHLRLDGVSLNFFD